MTITIDDIEKSLDYFETRQFSDKTEEEFISRYPSILKYLTSNQFNALSKDEYLILMFSSIIVLKTMADKYGIDNSPGEDLLEALETFNWQVVEETPARSFSQLVMSIMGEKENDLAQFIISSLEDDEEDTNEISLPAKKIIFVTLKTIFDALQHSLKDEHKH